MKQILLPFLLCYVSLVRIRRRQHLEGRTLVNEQLLILSLGGLSLGTLSYSRQSNWWSPEHNHRTCRIRDTGVSSNNPITDWRVSWNAVIQNGQERTPKEKLTCRMTNEALWCWETQLSVAYRPPASIKRGLFVQKGPGIGFRCRIGPIWKMEWPGPAMSK